MYQIFASAEYRIKNDIGIRIHQIIKRKLLNRLDIRPILSTYKYLYVFINKLKPININYGNHRRGSVLEGWTNQRRGHGKRGVARHISATSLTGATTNLFARDEDNQ